MLIAACAVQAAVVAGRLHYGIEELSWVQPVLALALPPLAWVAFVSATRRPLGLGDLWHLAAPGFGLFARVVAPEVLDPAIIAVFLAYGVAVLLALRGAEVASARLGAGERPRRLWLLVGGALVASALADVAILAVAVLGQREWLGWMVTVVSAGTLLALGALMVAEEAATVAEPEEAPVASEGDAALVAALERLMEERRLWLDPDLTLARIARRMGVPAKALSAAVNRVKGENISRVVNGWRVAEAGCC